MRIKESDLQAVVDRINRITGSPLEQYTKTKEGKFIANIGNYHLNSAYGGHGLSRMMNEVGGVTTIIPGFSPKRELYDKMQAFIMGLDAKK